MVESRDAAAMAGDDRAGDGTGDALRVERIGAVCRLTLDRPGKRNPLGEEVRVALRDELTSLADDPSVRVVVLGGAGPSFSAGADLAGQGTPQSDWTSRRHASGAWQRLLGLLGSIPQVTVARLHGHVIGGAVLLAASCDVRVGDPTVQLRIPELALGIPLTWGGNQLLAREVGLARAREWVMTGRTISAPEAHQAGFLQRLVPAGGLDDLVDEVVGELLAMPAGPLALTRASFNAIGAATGHPELGWADADLLRWSQLEPEAQQAALAYAERLRARRS
jgi:enoyl-CoA hydratase/carnithine racemase